MNSYGWERYLNIEREFLIARQYVSFSEVGSMCSDFSIKTSVLLGSHIEAAMKKICKLISGSEQSKIDEYKEIILGAYPNIVNWTAKLFNEKDYKPFENWNKNRLSWWDAYSEIKHNIINGKVTFDDALNMLGAYQCLLLVVQMKEHIEEKDVLAYDFSNHPQVFIPKLPVDNSLVSLDGGVIYHPNDLEKILKGQTV